MFDIISKEKNTKEHFSSRDLLSSTQKAEPRQTAIPLIHFRVRVNATAYCLLLTASPTATAGHYGTDAVWSHAHTNATDFFADLVDEVVFCTYEMRTKNKLILYLF